LSIRSTYLQFIESVSPVDASTGRDISHLRGAVTPCSGDDLEAVLGDRRHKQRRANALGANGLGQFPQGHFLDGAAGVGLQLVQLGKRDLAVLNGIDDLGRLIAPGKLGPYCAVGMSEYG
jgi:hypothetical protein